MKRITKVLNIICLTLLITTITTLSFAAPPTITSVSPSSGKRGQTLDIFITGTNLGGATSVYFTGTDIKVNSFFNEPCNAPHFSRHFLGFKSVEL